MNRFLPFLFSISVLFSCDFRDTSSSIQSSQSNQIPSEIRDSLETIILNLSTADSVPTEYLTYFGFRDWYRWPLIYPYSLNAIDVRENGFLCNESFAESISQSNKGIAQIYLGDIKRFTFNANILIAETGDSGNSKFKSFRFTDEKIMNYPSLSMLMEASAKYGEMIIDSLITLEQYNQLFVD